MEFDGRLDAAAGPPPHTYEKWKLWAIKRMIMGLVQWLEEDVTIPDGLLRDPATSTIPRMPTALSYYAYAIAPCVCRSKMAAPYIRPLITEFNFTHPGIGEELKKLADDLDLTCLGFDQLQERNYRVLYWIEPDVLNPCDAKNAAAALLGKLRHVYLLLIQPKAPPVAIGVIIRNFKVTKATLYRRVAQGDLIDYRQEGHDKSSPMMLDPMAVAQLYPSRK